jgi:hypothetical protein
MQTTRLLVLVKVRTASILFRSGLEEVIFADIWSFGSEGSHLIHHFSVGHGTTRKPDNPLACFDLRFSLYRNHTPSFQYRNNRRVIQSINP